MSTTARNTEETPNTERQRQTVRPAAVGGRQPDPGREAFYSADKTNGKPQGHAMYVSPTINEKKRYCSGTSHQRIEGRTRSIHGRMCRSGVRGTQSLSPGLVPVPAEYALPVPSCDYFVKTHTTKWPISTTTSTHSTAPIDLSTPTRTNPISARHRHGLSENANSTPLGGTQLVQKNSSSTPSVSRDQPRATG